MSPFFSKRKQPPNLLLVGGALLALGGLAWRLISALSRGSRHSPYDPLHAGDQKDIAVYSDVKTGQAITPGLSFSNKIAERPYDEEDNLG